jgi:hypothetical protein
MSSFNLKKDGKFGRRADCKDCRHKTEKIRSNKNKIQKSIYDAEYRKNNKNKKIALGKGYYATHKEKWKIYAKENRDRINETAKKRFDNNPSARIANTLRCLLRTALKGNVKNGSAVRDLGCTPAILVEKLGILFWLGMSVENKGPMKWHVDHIVPLRHFDLTDREQLLIACHWSNLQPLWEDDNKIKNGSLDWLPTESKHELPTWIGKDCEAYKQRVKFVMDKLEALKLKKAS